MVRKDYTMDLMYDMKVSFLVHKLKQGRQVSGWIYKIHLFGSDHPKSILSLKLFWI